MSTELFDLLDEQITGLLEDYVLSVNTFRSLAGSINRKWDMASRIDREGRSVWYVGAKSIISVNNFIFAPILITLNKDCSVYFSYITMHTIKDFDGFSDFVNQNNLKIKESHDEDSTTRFTLSLSSYEQLSQVLTYTV